MPTIKTPDGKLRFTAHPLYPGVKQIDKDIAFENLLIFKRIMDKNEIPFMLSYGTLLGAVRDNDFISHDEDIDLSIKEEYRDSFLSALKELYQYGFELVRYDRKDLYSIMRKGEYIDLYFFRPCGDNRWTCSGARSLNEFFDEPDTITFRGFEFKTHSNHIDYLLMSYGPNWQTPLKWNDYDMPKWKLAILNAKEYAKYILPDWLYYRLAKRAARKVTERCEKRIENYLKLKNAN
ncbi:MAG: LicD family protein [Bacteroides sp.]|nr:LicD family protein [Bacteroides sp.]